MNILSRNYVFISLFSFVDIIYLPGQKFFGELQDRKTEFGIADIQLGLTTLEEVFLNIAKKAELEIAAAEGSTESLTLASGVVVQVSEVYLDYI